MRDKRRFTHYFLSILYWQTYWSEWRNWFGEGWDEEIHDEDAYYCKAHRSARSFACKCSGLPEQPFTKNMS